MVSASPGFRQNNDETKKKENVNSKTMLAWQIKKHANGINKSSKKNLSMVVKIYFFSLKLSAIQQK